MKAMDMTGKASKADMSNMAGMKRDLAPAAGHAHAVTAPVSTKTKAASAKKTATRAASATKKAAPVKKVTPVKKAAPAKASLPKPAPMDHSKMPGMKMPGMKP
jgi:hypothetical protein